MRGPDDRTYEVQRVGERVNVSPMPGVELSVDADMAFVALAGTLDRDRLDAALRACLNFAPDALPGRAGEVIE